MTKGKPHIDESTFRRYLNDEMTNAERNAFEKELQKDPFAAEALEGFELLSTQNLEQDLNELKTRIQTPKKKKRTPYFAAAATILLLVAAGVIWMQLDKQDPVPKMTENKIEQESKTEESAEKELQVKVEKPAPIITEKEDNILTKQKPDKPSTKEIQVPKKVTTPRFALKAQEEKVVVQQDEAKSAILEITDNELELDDEITYTAPTIQAKNQKRTQTLNSLVQGKVISADDQLPIPGVNIIEKGTNNAVITDLDGQFKLQLNKDSSSTLVASFIGMETNEFQPYKDSSNLIRLKPDEIDMSEVVVVGYGSQKKKEVTSSDSVVKSEPKNTEAKPVGGYTSYYDYLNKKAILPDDFAKKKLVVKLQVELDANGKVETIKNTNNVDEEFFIKAKTLVENGPEWQAEYFNDHPVKSTVKLRIVFRKQEK